MARAGPFQAHISLYQEKTNQKKPSNNGLSTLPTLSQPQCSPSLQTLHVFFFKKNFPFISLWRLSLGLTIRFSPAPRQGDSPGRKVWGGRRGWVTTHPKEPSPHYNSSPRESGSLSWPCRQLGRCKEVVPPPYLLAHRFTSKVRHASRSHLSSVS